MQQQQLHQFHLMQQQQHMMGGPQMGKYFLFFFCHSLDMCRFTSSD